jgi:hypothetical protein
MERRRGIDHRGRGGVKDILTKILKKIYDI